MSAADQIGFSKETLQFLSDLKANNTRDWFKANKGAYEASVKVPAAQFCADMEARLEALTGLPHRSKVFRIHRDVRFSKDKTPYNAHVHISFFSDGGTPPHWFFGLEPGSLTLGTGIFAFDKPALEAYRARVAGKDGEVLANILADLTADGARFNEPELKRIPSGYDSDHPNGALIRRKGLSAWLDMGEARNVIGPKLPETCVAAFTRLMPVYSWLMKD